MEVVFATPMRQELIELEIDGGSTIADAIEQSGLQRRFRDIDLSTFSTGIWGRLAPREHQLQDGDRVEIYRPLEQDPRDARRELAKHQRSGSSS